MVTVGNNANGEYGFFSLFVFLISKLIGWVKNLCGFGTKSNVEQIDDQKVIVETASVGMSEPNQEES